jgi:hypothetical protein
MNDELLFAIHDEAARGRALNGPHHSAHEGFAILSEEVDELWDEVKTHRQNPDAMAQEALQVAAMAFRFLQDCCGDEVVLRLCRTRQKSLTALPKRS